MSDITKCDGLNCPLKDTCYRHTATTNEYYQSWFMEIPLQENGTCEYYWETKHIKNEQTNKLQDNGS